MSTNLAEVERIIDLADKSEANHEEMHHQFCVDNSDNGILIPDLSFIVLTKMYYSKLRSNYQQSRSDRNRLL